MEVSAWIGNNRIGYFALTDPKNASIGLLTVQIALDNLGNHLELLGYDADLVDATITQNLEDVEAVFNAGGINGPAQVSSRIFPAGNLVYVAIKVQNISGHNLVNFY